MLHIRTLSSALDRQALFESLSSDPLRPATTWVVSDLRSKLMMQQHAMQKNGYFEDQLIVRANELWATLVRRSDFRKRIVSREFVKTWVRQNLAQLEKEYKLGLQAGAEDLLLEFMDDFAQAITNEQGPAIIQDWLEQNPTAQARWGLWFRLATQLQQQMLEQNYLTHRWLAPWLSNQEGFAKQWKRNLIVDLGADLTRAEKDLFVAMSAHCDVTFLEPQIQADAAFAFCKRPYTELREQLAGVADIQPAFGQTSGGPAPQILRWTSPLSEVKHATSQVRQWIEQGVPTNEILLVAPDLENYWPLIEQYFAEEGIPIAKDSTIRMQSLAPLQWLLARIKVAQRTFEYPDLASAMYSASADTAQELRFERFEALFKNLLGAEDLARHPDVQLAFAEDRLPTESINYRRFVGILLRFWPADADTEHLQTILREVLQVGEESLSFTIDNWLFWFSRIVSRLEITLKKGVRLGVQLANVMAADAGFFRRRIFLGMNEENFKSNKNPLLSPSEIEQIYQSTGFHCQHPEQSPLNFELRWLLQVNSEKDQLSYPMTTWNGTITAPHPFWMQLSTMQENSIATGIPERTRLDSVQQQPAEVLGQLRGWGAEKTMSLLQQVARDAGTEAFADFTAKTQGTFSASQLETFFDCPFKFAAGKMFKLLDEAEMDLDPDARSQGRIVHKLFEILGAEPRRFDWSAEELYALLEQIYVEQPVGDPRLWPPLREKLIRLGQRFLRFEKESLDRKKTLAVEKSFQLDIDGAVWKGSIDRIDLDTQDRLIVYDYKARGADLGLTQWEKQNHLQLAFYSWLLANQKIEDLAAFPFGGAFYYIYRDFTQAGANVESKKIDLLIQQIEKIPERMGLFRAQLQAGQFPAKPRDEKLCTTCPWSMLCRAPHLMN